MLNLFEEKQSLLVNDEVEAFDPLFWIIVTVVTVVILSVPGDSGK